MSFSRLYFLTAFAALLSLAKSDNDDGTVFDPDSICYSYGVDFVDEGHYFINSQSTEQFSAVSTFQGCNTGEADILLVDPNNTEYLCDDIPTTPDNTKQLSTCPIQKSQMSSGHWILLILGNNGEYPAQPFAWQRDLYLTIGTQVTSTYTPTITATFSVISIITKTQTTTSILVTQVGPFTTSTIPSATAKKTKTITPKVVTTTSTKTLTKTSLTATRVFSTTTQTATATCKLPGQPLPDKPCRYTPTRLHPAALATPTTISKQRYMRRTDRPVDYEWARARIEAAKQRRNEKARGLQRRAPDSATTTITAATPITMTTTVTAEATTTIETVLITSTSTSELPPATVYFGVYTSTTTLPTPTQTYLRLGWATTTSTITWGATFTRYTTVTPSASASACKQAGGHF
ncbi:uncharacterized protein M421DRAFT_418381 [Didymella exigua CBS 183.55]|uniref:Uncharacterized protein n=1 Tax=Didymella exigua CBS 183.55 TaxID=1150837 RepID=A0A6A5RRD1_9PLEO|nr:uncharacterized protein M421DRAFT_418381 [Didymella exigua CBS 183.55]KAF1930905.1 hypothetical protein M421DRAFT_418381 [Didymella exigua CBS 183.55]